jgi:methionine aminopeptidase
MSSLPLQSQSSSVPVKCIDLTKYNICAKICGTIMKELVENIRNKTILNVLELCKYGNNRIIEECNKIYKKETIKGIAFPTCISLNNCSGNYIYEESKGDEFNFIKVGDIIKIEIGVNISGCIAILGETITYDNSEEDDIIKLLNGLQKDIVKMIKVDEINDEIKIHVESKCTEYNCFPIENCTSYQQLDGHLNTQDSKFIILNYNKYYDGDDNLVVDENLCFEFEEGDIFNINLTVIKNNQENDEHTYIESHEPHIYRYNEYFYNLKLKTSREFFSMIKSKYGNNAFDCREYKSNIRNRIGIKESLENGIMTGYPILYSKDKSCIYHKKFTIIVGKDKSMVLKY